MYWFCKINEINLQHHSPYCELKNAEYKIINYCFPVCVFPSHKLLYKIKLYVHSSVLLFTNSQPPFNH